MYKILIVEDDEVIGRTVQNHLREWGYEAACVKDLKHVLAEFAAFEPHLVLMDILLPYFNGCYWCGEIRKLSNVPVIFLSSASDNMNIIMAVSMGGDDFIAKPFDLNVMTAKIQAMLRRTYDFAGDHHLIEHGGAVLNINDATQTHQEMKVELTKNEFRILKLLMEQAGRTVSREEVMTRLWETDSYVDDNTLTVNVNRLRKKLDGAGLEDFIVTKKGMGYMVR